MNKNYCYECGKEIQQQYKLCYECYAKTEKENKKEKQEITGIDFNDPITIAIISFLAGLLIGIFIF